MPDLSGKVAVVTGAGHGIGRAHALLLAAHGAAVVVNDLGTAVDGTGLDASVAEQVAALIRDRGGEAAVSGDDIGDWSGAAATVRTAIDTFGRLDIVVNNAGIARDRMIVSMTEDDFDSVVRVHLKGTFAVTKHAADHWRERSKAGERVSASVINTVSGAGLQGNVGQANYGAAKAGIAAFTIISSLELARYGVRVNAIAPSGLTRISKAIMGDAEVVESDDYEQFDPQDPGNAAPLVVWLASDESTPVTGQVLRAVGSSIGRYEPWRLAEQVDNPRGARRWDVDDIGRELHTWMFRTIAPGLQIKKLQSDAR